MPPFGGIQGGQRLLEAARTYHACFQYSVIPIFGDASPEKAKAAAVDWKKYQQQHATDADFQRWFLQDKFQGLAIITGKISGVVVLDFDDENLSRQFARQYPHLAETRMVRSAGRGLPHYYFRLPPHLSVSSQKTPGVDLQSDGRYIIAPPTSLNGRDYKVAVGGMAYTLTANDVRLLDKFMADVRGNVSSAVISSSLATKQTEVGTQNSNPSETAHFVGMSEDAPEIPKIIATASEISVHKSVQNPIVPKHQSAINSRLSAELLIQQYRTQAQLIGRNQALFQQACIARDAGWTQFMTTAVLAPAHVDLPAPPNHAKETPAQRQHEAAATIKSAFSRPRRQRAAKSLPTSPTNMPQSNPHISTEARPGLPGSLREKLLQLGQCHSLRVLDALLLANIQPGTLLTEKSICEILHNVVGRYSIRQALQATLPDACPIFQRAKPAPAAPPSEPPTSTTPSPAPPTPTAVAADSVVTKNNKCLLFRVTNSDKNQRGRPAAWFMLPSPADLCARLGLKLTGSDALNAGDVASAKQYRQSLHREFLQRRPGQYSRKWLAQRLGVSVRSIQRYHHTSGIRTKPVYHALPLAWHNLKQIPVGLPIGGMFIQSESGKRYPPLREIARALLAKKERIVLMRQDVNYYAVPQPIADADRPALSLAQVAHLPEKAMLEHLRQLTAQPVRASFDKYSNLAVSSSPPAPLHCMERGASPAVSSPLVEKINATDSIIMPRAMPKFVRRPVLTHNPAPAYQPQARRYYRQPLADATREQAAQQLYSALRDRCSDKKGYLTLAKARRLSEEFGVVPIQQALTTINARQNIHNPAGFVMVFLRSQAAQR